jgi:phosphoribosyl-ATP pyrophosphohydrolase
MAKAVKSSKKLPAKKAAVKKAVGKKVAVEKKAAKTPVGKKLAARKAVVKAGGKPRKKPARVLTPIPAKVPTDASSAVLDRLWQVVLDRRNADPSMSHSARLMSRGTPKIAQKFGEEAVECLIEAVAGNRAAFVAESADVLYHLLVLWVDGGVRPEEVWTELERREGVSGIAEKASRITVETRKIP